jgi:metallophosphoesterase superfamily enzyme
MKMEFLGDGPALVIENSERVLVVADLHFGIEADLAAHGLHFRSHSAERLERLIKTIDASRADSLVLLGDIKHSIPTLTRQEFFEMPGVFSALRERIPLVVFPGNHDIGIERFLHHGELQPKEGAVIDGVGYLHGHMYPAAELAGHLIICGHHHPMVSLYDDVGCSLQAPAYLRAGIDSAQLGLAAPDHRSTARALFMPAFNEIAGYDIFRITRDPFSPLSRYMDTEHAEVILADGTYIGPLNALEHDDDR